MNILSSHTFGNASFSEFSNEMKEIFSTKFPLKNKVIPSSFSIRTSQLQNNHIEQCDSKRINMAELKERFYSEKIQKMLLSLSRKFIYDYVDTANKYYFSSIDAYILKEKYFDMIRDSITSISKVNPHGLIITPAEKKQIAEVKKSFHPVEIVSDDPVINNLISEIGEKLEYLREFTEVSIDFLLLGERGTGKDVFAKAIHKGCGRIGEFIRVDCARVEMFEAQFFGIKGGVATDVKEDKKGFFEQALDGVLFLDEIGNLPLEHQKKLLVALDSDQISPIGADQKKGQVVKGRSIRIFATNKPLEAMCENGEFMPDLYDRISSNTYVVPPLKERKGDIPLLVRHFIDLSDVSRKKKANLAPIEVSPDCMNLLINYDWPENVRGVRNVIEPIMQKSVVWKDRQPITSALLPKKIQEHSSTSQKRSVVGQTKPLPAAGKRYLSSREDIEERLLEYFKFHGKSRGAIKDVAGQIGVSYEHLSREMKKLGINTGSLFSS
jgi:transcriptional regulator with PAS, ATPase and Fis domain